MVDMKPRKGILKGVREIRWQKRARHAEEDKLYPSKAVIDRRADKYKKRMNSNAKR